MIFLRRWLFPGLKLLAIAALAVGVCKIAFLPDTPAEVNAATATAKVVTPTVKAAKSTITNTVEFAGTVTADAAIPATITTAGTVNVVAVSVGSPVNAGDVLLDVKIPIEPEPVLAAPIPTPTQPVTGDDSTKSESTNSQVVPAPIVPEVSYRYESIVAPASGTVSALTAVTGGAVSIGDTVAQIAPPGFSVTAAVAATDLYRLDTIAKNALVTIPKGPAPFTCTTLRLVVPLAGSAAAGTVGSVSTPATNQETPSTAAPLTDSNTSTTANSGAMITCTVPRDVKVFNQLPATITIVAGSAKNAVTVPTSAVQGSANKGVVWVVGQDGTPKKKQVTLGLSDGTSIQITKGIKAGQNVLEFVPSTSKDGS